ncbi:MAG: mechanosensitive ion channel family protein [Halobacteria archaeon]|nr:mechanosensitive ion channel family protein [Halobacteria archaeon]
MINGIFVLGDQPYEIGDMIELVDTGQRGFVDDVTIRYTKVFTLENTFLVIPNSEIRKRDVNNYSAEDIRTRQTTDVSVTYESDVEKARELMVEAAEEVPEVISTTGSIRIGNGEYPMEPRAHIVEFGDHGVSLRLRYWLREPYNIPQVKSKINERIWRKFKSNEVRIPYPHRHHIFDDTSGEGRFEVSMREKASDDGAESGREDDRGDGTDADDPSRDPEAS